MLFDNHGDSGGSRLLIVEVSETTASDDAVNDGGGALAATSARVVWEHPLGVVANVFGDHDRLPSGNLLTSFWGATWGTNRTDGGGMDAMARVLEVSRWPCHTMPHHVTPCHTHTCEVSRWHEVARGDRARGRMFVCVTRRVAWYMTWLGAVCR